MNNYLCKICYRELNKKNITGLCNKCWTNQKRLPTYGMTFYCKICNKQTRRKTKSGLCKECFLKAKREKNYNLIKKQKNGWKTEHNRYQSPENRLKKRLFMIDWIKKTGKLPILGHNEKEILDEIEKDTGIKILRQYECMGYFIDGYIPKFNIAIEIDEKYHKRRKEKDIIRQKEIENKLQCTTIRINCA